jgi:hypothetical protein
MSKVTYHKMLSLNQEDYDKLTKLQKLGLTIIAIFRKGLEVLDNGNKPKDTR